MNGWIAFPAQALAALLFIALILWRLREGVRLPVQRLMLAGFALTACWAWLGAIAPGSPLAQLAETFRNFTWLALLHSLSGGGEAVERQRGVRLVYGAVGAVLGLQLVADLLPLAIGAEPTIAVTATLLRITAAAGLLVLVHNLYGQADPASRSAIGDGDARAGRDLGLRPQPLHPGLSRPGVGHRAGRVARSDGRADRAVVRDRRGPRRRLANPAVARRHLPVAVAARDLRLFRGDDDPRHRASRIGVRLVAADPGGDAGGDDRGGDGAAAEPARAQLGSRSSWPSICSSIATIIAPNGCASPTRSAARGRTSRRSASGWSRPSPTSSTAPAGCCWWPTSAARSARPRRGTGRARASPPTRSMRRGWSELEQRPADPRARRASPRREARGGSALPVPPWLDDDRSAWCGIPLVHGGKLIGLVLLAAPEFRRALDWEDFDLLQDRRAAGREQPGRSASASRRWRRRNGSTNSTAASPSSSTTSRIWSANCRWSRAMPSATPTIPNSAPT